MEQENINEKKAMSSYLASALDMEDHMSLGVYGEFLKRDAWPDGLSNEAFDEIKNLLIILINETEGHKKAFSELKQSVK